MRGKLIAVAAAAMCVVPLAGNAGALPVLGATQRSALAPGLLEGRAIPGATDLVRLTPDGPLSLVVFNFATHNVSVMLGNGDGTFGSPTNYFVGLLPASGVVGDFNRDENVDIAAGNAGGNTVSILLGNGDGTFRRGGAFAAGAVPLAVGVGDLDRDGKLDLIVADGVARIAVLIGHGDGTFARPQSFPTHGLVTDCIRVADLRGIGVPDVITANTASANLSVFLGDGHGGLGAPTTYASGIGPFCFAVGDVSRDHHLDLVVANAANDVAVLLGRGDGTFHPARHSPEPAVPIEPALADFDGDGNLDVAVANAGTFDVSVRFGHGDGTFGPAKRYVSGLAPFFVDTGDIDGDGHIDMSVTNGGSADVASFLNNGDGTFRRIGTF